MELRACSCRLPGCDSDPLASNRAFWPMLMKEPAWASPLPIVVVEPMPLPPNAPTATLLALKSWVNSESPFWLPYLFLLRL